MKTSGCWVEGNWAWLVLVLEVLAVGCGATKLTPSGDGAEQPEMAGATAAEPTPGSGLPLSGDPGLGWSLRDDTPAGRFEAGAAIDTRRDRVIVLGGESSDVWTMALSGAQQKLWARITPEGDVPPFGAAAAVYDESADRLVIAIAAQADTLGGGYEGVEVWELLLGDAPRFQRLGAEIPELAPGASVAVRADGNRLFAQGSRPGQEGFWELSLESNTWQLVAATGLTTYGMSLVLDEPRHRLVAFGGLDIQALSLETQTWSTLGRDPCNSRAAWSQIVLDAARERVISIGGECSSTATFSLIEGKWQTAEERVDELGYGAALIDQKRERLLGFFADGIAARHGNATLVARLDDLSLVPFTPNTRGLAVDTSAASVWDPVRKAVVTFGGSADATLAHRLGSSASWQSLGLPDTDRGPAPGGIYDPSGKAIIAFGGDFTSLGVTRLASNGGRGWEVLEASGPDIRGEFVGVYDSDTKEFVVHGGVRDPSYPDRSAVLSDVWALSLGDHPTWTELNPTGQGPGARQQHAGVYDPVGKRLIVYGGRNGETTYDDLYALSLGESAREWSQLVASGEHPALQRPKAVYDADGKRMVLVALPNVVALELGDAPSWHTFCPVGTPPKPPFDQALIVTLVPDGLFVSVGSASYRFDLATPYCD